MRYHVKILRFIIVNFSPPPKKKKPVVRSWLFYYKLACSSWSGARLFDFQPCRPSAAEPRPDDDGWRPSPTAIRRVRGPRFDRFEQKSITAGRLARDTTSMVKNKNTFYTAIAKLTVVRSLCLTTRCVCRRFERQWPSIGVFIHSRRVCPISLVRENAHAFTLHTTNLSFLTVRNNVWHWKCTSNA